MPSFEVRIPGVTRSYRVAVERGLIDRAGPEIQALSPGPVAVVTDENVARLHLGRLRASLPEPPRVEVVLPPGERTKSLERAAEVVDSLVDAGLDRGTVLVALGGGVVGDLAGFAASLYLRGIRWVMVPTTLLAQVDSSVGGKVGVNLPRGKNLLGAFHQPSLVLADPAALETLPDRELAAGMAEVVKTALIGSRLLFERLQAEIGRLLSPGGAAGAAEVVLECCQIKARVVEADERESGLRRILNFGHTLGHAIEAATGFSAFRHGEAVALGMRAALVLSRDRGGLPPGDFVRALELVHRIPVPDFPIPRDRDLLAEMIRRDKKVEAGTVQAVVLEGIGRAKTVQVPVEAIVEGMLSL
ncbi:MAG: 3-dehydroquinate synthase [Planctomycetes bacterium]|nr:3-dehydroquinate synthase [Planctomycetota bacterium]